MTPIIFINCLRYAFVDAILSGLKLYESRNRNTLKRFLGTRVLLAETGHGKPVVKGSAIISEIIEIFTKEEWNYYKYDAWIRTFSEYDWNDNTKKKVLYRLTDVRPCEPFVPAEDRRHGRVWMEYHGSDFLLD